MHDPQSLPVPYMKVTAAISHKNKTQNKIHENYFAWITLVIFEKGKKKKQSTAAFSHKIIIYYVTFTLHNMKTLGSLTNILQTFFGPHAIKFLKVRQSRNVFFKLTILPKNERTNTSSTMIELFHSVFGRIRGEQKVLSKLTDL